MSLESDTEFILYTYFRSTSSARVRTAARLKGITVKNRYISVAKNQHLETEYENINPNLTVPTLIIKTRGIEARICQSVAILEFLEESNLGASGLRLLPPAEDLLGRAHVRQLVNLITCDIQPPTN